MKAGMIITDSGPIVILTACGSLEDPRVLRQLANKGIGKFIAFELPIDVVKERYGQHFAVTVGDLKQTDDLRVLDEEGHRVFYNFELTQLGQPLYYDEPALRKAA